MNKRLGWAAMLVCGVAGSAAMGQAVEIVDWVSVAGISRDSSQHYEVVRSGVLPYDGEFYNEYSISATTPEAWINPYFGVRQSASRFAIDIFWSAEVLSASGDSSTDSPFCEFAVLVRTSVPLTHDIESFAYIGSGAGNGGVAPWSRLSIVEGFCFTPGASPVAGQEWCSGHGGSSVVRVDHMDSSGFEADLSGCCPVVPDVGSQYGVLDPGEYTIYLRTGADINLLFSGSNTVDVTGSNSLFLNWAEPACEPDINGDGIVDLGDITDFVQLFLAQDLAADFNGDSIIDIGDISSFVTLFLAGC